MYTRIDRQSRYFTMLEGSGRLNGPSNPHSPCRVDCTSLCTSHWDKIRFVTLVTWGLSRSWENSEGAGVLCVERYYMCVSISRTSVLLQEVCIRVCCNCRPTIALPSEERCAWILCVQMSVKLLLMPWSQPLFLCTQGLVLEKNLHLRQTLVLKA